MSIPIFTMMVGLPGSGKSTYAEKLSKERSAIICSSDKVREDLEKLNRELDYQNTQYQNKIAPIQTKIDELNSLLDQAVQVGVGIVVPIEEPIEIKK